MLSDRKSYLVAILMQVCGDKIQSEKEKFTFLILCFIHAQDCTCARVKISFASLFAWLKITLFLCFQMHHITEIHRLFHSLLPSLLKHKQKNWSKWFSKALWFTVLIPSQLLHMFHTEFDTLHVMRMCEVDSSSLPHRGQYVSLIIIPFL